MKRRLIPFLLGLLIPIGLAYLGLFDTLGAHIWWDKKTALIGAPIGVFLSMGLAEIWAHHKRRTTLWAIALGISIAAAKYGQVAFVTSYGENALAGQFWYFGWIAISLTLAAVIASILRR